MVFDSNNRLWCGTSGGGLICLDGAKWNSYTTSNSSLPSNYVGAIAVDNNDVVWLNCRDNQYPDKYGAEYGFGLTRFDGNTWTTYGLSVARMNCKTSSIHPVTPSKPSDLYYDLQGRRISQPIHGIYITNGNKIVK